MSEMKQIEKLPPPRDDAAPESPAGLRDWLAGQALAGILASKGTDFEEHRIAALAYSCADAMLRERLRT